MRHAQACRQEIDGKLQGQFFPVPGVRLEVLQVFALFRLALVPVGQQGRGEIYPFPVPALGQHVDLCADLLRVNLLCVMGVADIEHPGHAVVPGVHPQQRVIRRDGNVHGQRNLLGDADIRNRLRVPVASVIFVDQPDLGRERGGGEAIIITRAPGATEFQRRPRHIQHLFRLAFVQVPDDHGIAEALHGFRVRHHLAQVHHVIVPAGK